MTVESAAGPAAAATDEVMVSSPPQARGGVATDSTFSGVPPVDMVAAGRGDAVVPNAVVPNAVVPDAAVPDAAASSTTVEEMGSLFIPGKQLIDVSRETDRGAELGLRVIDLRVFDRQPQSAFLRGTTEAPRSDSPNDSAHQDFVGLQAPTGPRGATTAPEVGDSSDGGAGRVSAAATGQTEHPAPHLQPAGSSVMTDQPTAATPVVEWTPPAVVTLPDTHKGGPQFSPPGAPLAAPMYNDEDRVQLVQSLPQVDDSTPLAAEVAEDARRRISLVGKPFPIPPRTRVLTVANQKGGVGKTTTTVNIAAAMAQAGLNVLVLDIDPQGNASTALGIDHHADVPSLYDVVIEDRPLREVVQTCPDVPNLFCAPATIDLAGAEIELVSLVARPGMSRGPS
jgi:AAA domain